MAAIFLSHFSRNDTLTSALELWLKANGFDDLFVDYASIRSGDKWMEALRRAKASYRVVLCLVTPEWLSSDECYGEFNAACYMGRRIIPLLAVGAAPLDDRQKARFARVLGEDQGVDITRAGAPADLKLDGAPKIAESLKAGLRAAGALAKIGLDPFAFEIDRERRSEPFPGLESFSDEDADAAIFFGRGPEIALCLEDLREMRASRDSHAYAVLGASGSGKSSLMKAGLLPRLRREQGWFALRAFRPGTDPLLNFADAIARTAGEHDIALSAGSIRDSLRDAWSVHADLRAALDAIVSPLKLKAGRPIATVLIAIDQAEELANAGGENGGADALGSYLKAVLKNAQEAETSAYAVMLTVRSDSFAELQAAKRFDGVMMRTADIRTLPLYRFASTIEQPAARYGVEIEPALVDTLIEHAGGKDSLPLLAFTLQRLWRQYKSDRRISRANYDSVGQLSGLIEDAAERALRGIDPLAPQGPLEGKISADQDRQAARVFVPALATVNDRGAAIRRVANLEQFDERARDLLRQFDRWRLVVKSNNLIEVAHEAMFREWPRFKRWLEPEKTRLEALRGVESAAAIWKAKGCKADDLIHHGKRLAEIRKLDDIADYKAQLDEDGDARAYLTAATAAERQRNVKTIGGAGVLLAALVIGAVLINTAYSIQITNWARIAAAMIGGDLGHGGAPAISPQQAATLKKAELALKARVGSALEEQLKERNEQAGWTIAEYNLALGDYNPAEQQNALSFLDQTRLPGKACWPEFVVDSTCHVGATAWALYSLAKSNRAALPASVNSLLDVQSKEGWWPMYFSLSGNRMDASTYATAWALMAIAAQEKFSDAATKARIDKARSSAANWLVTTRLKDRYRWKDYPFSDEGVVSDSISAVTIVALNEAGQGTGLNLLNRGWLRDLPFFPSGIGTLEISNVALSPTDRVWLYDKTRYTVAPWVILSLAWAARDGDRLGQAKARVYRDDFAAALSSYDTASGPDYLASDLLYGTDQALGSASK